MSQKPKNPHIGSTFESWLDEQGIRAEVTTEAVAAVSKHMRERDNPHRGQTLDDFLKGEGVYEQFKTIVADEAQSRQPKKR